MKNLNSDFQNVEKATGIYSTNFLKNTWQFTDKSVDFLCLEWIRHKKNQYSSVNASHEKFKYPIFFWNWKLKSGCLWFPISSQGFIDID